MFPLLWPQHQEDMPLDRQYGWEEAAFTPYAPIPFSAGNDSGDIRHLGFATGVFRPEVPIPALISLPCPIVCQEPMLPYPTYLF